MFARKQRRRYFSPGKHFAASSGMSRLHGVEQLETRQLLDGHGVLEQTDAEIDEKIDSFKAYFDGVLASQHDRFVSMSTRSGRDSVQLYNLQLAVDGILSMYEATGDLATLDHAIEYTTNVMESAQVIDNGHYERDGFVDWETTSGGRPLSTRWGNMLHDFQYGSAMSRLARIIHEDARLADVEQVQSFGDQLVGFIDEQIIFKWLDARGQRDWLERFYDRGYWSDKATHITTICNNMTQVMGESSSCAGIQFTLGEQFKNLLVVAEDGAYQWGQFDAWPSANANAAPDTNHENRTATMITQLGADNVVFDTTDIEHLGKTFTERIWNGRTDWEDSPKIQDSPWFHNYVDGSDDNYRNYTTTDGTAGMNGFVFDGWIRLGEFVPEVQVAGESLLSFVRAFGSNVNAIRQRNGSIYGKIALSGHLARNLREIQQSRSDVEVPVVAQLRQAPSPLPGDADGDGIVGFSDFLVLANNFGNKQQTWADGDFTYDGVVDMSDFLILAAAFSDKVAE